jgi:cell division septum initiation protein DivIVA
MSINLVSLASQFLTPDMIAKIASMLGVDRTLVGKAVTAAVPALLGSFAGLAGSPQGAKSLFDAVSQQPSGLLASLGSALGGSDQTKFAEAGSSTLSSLLGHASTSALAGAVEKFSGLGGGAGSSLVGLLTPVVLGALGQQKASGNLDASGLAGLLASQKSNISAALPGDLGKMLAGTGLLDSLGSGAAAAGQQAQAAASAAQAAARQAGGGLPGWVSWAIPVLAVLGIGYWLLKPAPQTAVDQAKQAADAAKQAAGQATQAAQTAASQATQAAQSAVNQATQAAQNAANQATQSAKDAVGQATQAAQGVVDKAKQAANQAVQSAQSLTVGAVDLGASLQKDFASLRDALSGITDEATAKAAVPKLQDATAQLEKLGTLTADLPATGRSAFAALVVAARPQIEELFTKVLAIPGAGDYAKPTIDTLRAKLDALAKTAG